MSSSASPNRSAIFREFSVDNSSLFASCVIRPDKAAVVQRSLEIMCRHRERYEMIASKFTGMPWYFVGVIHGMESDFNFGTHLHNGDPLTARTVNVPVGRPPNGAPPFTWEESAIDAMMLWRFDRARDFTVLGMLYLFELLNGLGYRRYGVASPYLWGCSNHYTKGKIEKDGQFDPERTSENIGAATLLKALQIAGEGILSEPTQLEIQTSDEPEPREATEDQVGVLLIRLADEITVHQLAAFLAVAETIYFNAIWVQGAEKARNGVFPDSYNHSPEEELWINQLDVGTPNFLELLGDLSALSELAKYFGAFITTVAGGKVLVQYGELKLKLAQANLTNARAEELRDKGRISHEALSRRTAEVAPEKAEAMRAALNPQSLPSVRPAPIKKVDEIIRVELKSINRLDVLPILREHIRARRGMPRGLGMQKLREVIEATLQDLQTALAPMSDDDIQSLIERIDQ